MKITLLLSLVFVSSFSIAQIPSYFDNNQEWAWSFSFYSSGLSDCAQNSSNVYYVNGDTIMNGKTYTILGLREATSYFPMTSNPCPQDTWGDVPSYRYVRQSNDSIYEGSSQGGVEDLLISYNLNVGDNFGITNLVSFPYTVQSITTINVNGQNHRVFHIDTINNHYVIEGVVHYSLENSGFIDHWGSAAGLDHVASLKCYAQNDTTFWTNPNNGGSECSYMHDLSFPEESSDLNISIFPNPTSSALHLISDQIMESVEIRSIDGMLIRNQSINALETDILIDPLSTGSYLFIVKHVDGNTVVRRILKN